MRIVARDQIDVELGAVGHRGLDERDGVVDVGGGDGEEQAVGGHVAQRVDGRSDLRRVQRGRRERARHPPRQLLQLAAHRVQQRRIVGALGERRRGVAGRGRLAQLQQAGGDEVQRLEVQAARGRLEDGLRRGPRHAQDRRVRPALLLRPREEAAAPGPVDKPRPLVQPADVHPRVGRVLRAVLAEGAELLGRVERAPVLQERQPQADVADRGQAAPVDLPLGAGIGDVGPAKQRRGQLPDRVHPVLEHRVAELDPVEQAVAVGERAGGGRGGQRVAVLVDPAAPRERELHRRIGLHPGDQPLDARGRDDVVVEDELHVLAAGLLEQADRVVEVAEVALAVDDRDPRVAGGDGIQARRRVVRRRVVRDEDLEVVVGLAPARTRSPRARGARRCRSG